MTQSYVRHKWFMWHHSPRLTGWLWSRQMAMAHTCVRHVSFICVTSHTSTDTLVVMIYRWDMNRPAYTTHLDSQGTYDRGRYSHDSICETWIIHMCNMAHPDWLAGYDRGRWPWRIGAVGHSPDSPHCWSCTVCWALHSYVCVCMCVYVYMYVYMYVYVYV